MLKNKNKKLLTIILARKVYDPEIYANLIAKTNKQMFYSYRNDNFIS
tara:strand:- start:774 stop:914 length:141 start_codon:yes stop_codon:yes gene_type:complete